MTLKEIRDIWFNCYNEDLKTQYSGFYKKLNKLEKNNIKLVDKLLKSVNNERKKTNETTSHRI